MNSPVAEAAHFLPIFISPSTGEVVKFLADDAGLPRIKTIFLSFPDS